MATPGRSTRRSSRGTSRTLLYFCCCHSYLHGNYPCHYHVVQAFCPSLQQRRWMNHDINVNHPHLPTGRPRRLPQFSPSTRRTTYTNGKLDHDQDKKNNRSINEKALLFLKLDREFGALAMASFFHQAAVPLADLVNGAMLYSRLQDPVVLGAIGVARASQASISLIGSKVGNLQRRGDATDEMTNEPLQYNKKEEEEELSKAVTSGLVVALAIGLLQFACFTLLAEPMIRASGISPSTKTCNGAMYAAAVSYTRARATSAPSSTVWLVTTGIFRGLGDATTPLYCALLFNGLNIALNYLFVTQWQMVGIVRGVPLLTTVAQTLALIPLLLQLHKRVPFLPFLGTQTATSMTVSDLVDQFRGYFTAGMYLLGRSVVRISAISYCTRYAALLGPVAASSYTILYQIGFWVTMLSESISIAVQALLARQKPQKPQLEEEEIRQSPWVDTAAGTKHILRRSFQLGLLVSGVCAILLSVFGRPIVSIFTRNPEIQQSALEAVPFFCITQLVKGVCFPVNGMLMGELNWSASFAGMCLANVACFLALQQWPEVPTMRRLWTAWTFYYLAQSLIGVARFVYTYSCGHNKSQSSNFAKKGKH